MAFNIFLVYQYLGRDNVVSLDVTLSTELY